MHVETRNRLAGLLVAAMLFAQLFALGAVGGFSAALSALVEILVCLGLIALLGAEIPDRFWTQGSPIMLLFLGAMFWGAAPLALFGIRRPGAMLAPDAAPLELLKLSGVAAIALSGGLIGLSRSRLQHFAVNIVMMGLAYTLLSLWIGQASSLTVWGQPKGAHAYRFTGTLLNANAAGCVFGMIGLMGLGLLQSLLKRTDLRDSTALGYLRLALVGCGVVAAFGATALTQSRTGLALSILLGGALVAAQVRRGGGLRMSRRSGQVLNGIGVVVLVLGLALGASQISSRWDVLLTDAQLRGEAYLHYMRALAASPWFGCGLGGFRSLHQAILTPDLAPAMWDFGAAHSALMQAALEGGLPFVALLGGAMALIGLDILKPAPRRYRHGAVVSGVIAATGLAFAFSFVDIALNVPAIAALSMALFGVAWGDSVARRISAETGVRAVTTRRQAEIGRAYD